MDLLTKWKRVYHYFSDTEIVEDFYLLTILLWIIYERTFLIY